VTNTGALTGKEVAQVYVRDVHSKVARPEKELKAFRKVSLNPSETQTVTFTLDREAFWYFDTAKNDWAVEPGQFEILVGASSRDIRLKAAVEILPPSRPGARLHTGLSVRAVLDDPAGKAVLTKHLGGVLMMAEMSMVMEMSLEQVAEKFATFFPAETLKAIGDDLGKIE